MSVAAGLIGDDGDVVSGEKLVLSAFAVDWRDAFRNFAGEDPQRWRALGCLSLQLHGWSTRMIALVIGLHQANVVRIINQVRRELAMYYAPIDAPLRDLAGAACGAPPVPGERTLCRAQ